MRITKLLPIVASIITAGLLVLVTTSNTAIAQTSAQSIIAQLNKQATACLSGITTTNSCNLAASNSNFGNAVSAAAADPNGSAALSAIGQANQQSAFTLSGVTLEPQTIIRKSCKQWIYSKTLI